MASIPKIQLAGTVTMKGKPKGEAGDCSIQVSGMTETGAYNFWIRCNAQQAAGLVKGAEIECLCEAELTFEGALKPSKLLNLKAGGPAAKAA